MEEKLWEINMKAYAHWHKNGLTPTMSWNMLLQVFTLDLTELPSRKNFFTSPPLSSSNKKVDTMGEREPVMLMLHASGQGPMATPGTIYGQSLCA